jgi:hypothetical protein
MALNGEVKVVALNGVVKVMGLNGDLLQSTLDIKCLI